MSDRAQSLVDAAQELRAAIASLRFTVPVTHVYNPLDYAWARHEAYLRRFGDSQKRVVFLGMNPGPFGMVQTGVPFGEVTIVRDWMGLDGLVAQPAHPHPKRPVDGFNCTRSEVSGRRLWGLFAAKFGSASRFFEQHFVANYCPLAFFTADGTNVTPDKLPARQALRLTAACDAHLRRLVEVLDPEWLIGIGGFAAQRARRLFDGTSPKVEQILHPSPASPAANRDWAGQTAARLHALGVWR